MIYVFLAEGFEETEAIAPIDLLRRSGRNVITVGVGNKTIKGSHGIPVTADITAEEISLNDELEMIVLPGGMPGTINLEKSEYVQSAIDYCVKNRKFIGAICAAPSILGHKRSSCVCRTFESQAPTCRKICCLHGRNLRGQSIPHRQ